MTGTYDVKSLCDVCYEEIPGRILWKNGNVFLRKECPRHGCSDAKVEEDAEFFERFSRREKPAGRRYHTLVIPVTFRCNLDCYYCYAPRRDHEDMKTRDIVRAARSFEGEGVFFSGGEPTMRKDLPELLAGIAEHKPLRGIVTNGLKLADGEYLASLRRAGLNYVFFSFDSFRPENYGRTGKRLSGDGDMLSLKMKALEQLESQGVVTNLSVTVYPGLNDHEMKDLFLYALRKRSFIKEIRFRSCVDIGRRRKTDEYFTSALVRKFCEQTGLDEGELYQRHLTDSDQTIHHVMFGLRGLAAGRSFVFSGERIGSELGAAGKIAFLLRTASRISPADTVRALLDRPLFRMQYVRFIHWPTVRNVILEQVDRETAHLYGIDRVLNFCRSIILYSRDIREEVKGYAR